MVEPDIIYRDVHDRVASLSPAPLIEVKQEACMVCNFKISGLTTC